MQLELQFLEPSLQFNVIATRFYFRVVFLLDYMLATASEHSLPGFDEILFVCPPPFDLSGLGVRAKSFYFLPI